MFFSCLRNVTKRIELYDFRIFWTVVDIEHEVHLTESQILGLRTSGVVLRLHSLLALDRPRNHMQREQIGICMVAFEFS